MSESELKLQEELAAVKREYEDFVYIVSHDIKTPMRAIANIATWIEDDLGPDTPVEVLNNFGLLKNRVGRLEKMLNALLELSRVNRTEMESYEINIPKMVQDSITSIPNKTDVNFHLCFNLVNENCVTLGKKLNKVIFNLLDNAVRFHDKVVKNVWIEISENDSAYEIAVRDDGPGVDEQVREKIFSIFYTVNSKDVVDTTGAGLTIGSKIVEMVGGTILYLPAEDTGSIFKFSWPKIINLKN